MTSVGPIQRLNLVKSFLAVFLVSTVIWAAALILVSGDPSLGWFSFLASLGLGLALGWGYYRRRYHAVLRYDAQGFELQWGPRRLEGKWGDFGQVSLVHLGYGEFAVRLYHREGPSFVEIPVSALRLDPSDFRFKVIGFVQQAGGLRRTEEGSTHG